MILINQKQIDFINNILVDYLNDQNLKIAEVKFARNEFMPESTRPILFLTIKNANDDALLVKQTAKIARILNENLDKTPLFWKMDFGIDVSSAGAEQIITTLDELKLNIGKYINVIMDDDSEHQGKLLDVINSQLMMRIDIKGRIKTIYLEYGATTFIRQAISISKEVL